MTLNEHAAALRLALLDDLVAGRPPREGHFEEARLREARTKGRPQIGATRYLPSAIVLEYVFPDPGSSSVIVAVEVPTDRRIVYLAVPEWVVENIWQGEIAGSYQFEDDAVAMLDRFRRGLEPDANAAAFGPAPSLRRD